MKTVIIFDQQPEPLQFFVILSDVSHLDGVYINDADQYHLQDELYDLLYGRKAKRYSKFPTKAVINGAKVIVCGLLP